MRSTLRQRHLTPEGHITQSKHRPKSKINMETKNQILIYSSNDETNLQIDVRIDEETVWLTQAQMLELFASTKQNISLHINNIYRENELNKISTVKEFLTVQFENGRSVKRKIKHYNLDVIISVGYRVKSKRGTQFRIWANTVLKEYLLKGYIVSNRLLSIENRLYEHDQKIEFLINKETLPEQGIFYEGQIFDAYSFAADIIKLAKKSIVLIDNFVDETTLLLLSKRSTNVSCIIYTANFNQQLKLDLHKHNQQYPEIEIKTYKKSHDRFLIIDNKTIYHIGASLKDLGKKWFAFSKINLDMDYLLEKLN